MKLFITDLKKIIKRRDILFNAEKKLKQNDKIRFASFGAPNRALQFLTARMLIEKFVSPDYETLQSGKIVLKKGFVSIAHSKNFVVVASSDTPVGVDIEKITEKKDFEKIAARMQFKNCHTPYDFFKNWTAYEADFKCDVPKKRKTHLFIDHQGFLICVSSFRIKNIEIRYVSF